MGKPIIIRDLEISRDTKLEGLTTAPYQNYILQNCYVHDVTISVESPLAEILQEVSFVNCKIQNLIIKNHTTRTMVYNNCQIDNIVIDTCNIEEQLCIVECEARNINFYECHIHDLESLSTKFVDVKIDTHTYCENMILSDCLIAKTMAFLDDNHVTYLNIMDSSFQKSFCGKINGRLIPVFSLDSSREERPPIIYIPVRTNCVYNHYSMAGEEIEEAINTNNYEKDEYVRNEISAMTNFFLALKQCIQLTS